MQMKIFFCGFFRTPIDLKLIPKLYRVIVIDYNNFINEERKKMLKN